MSTLNRKNVVVIGGSEGIGREVILAARAAGATTLAVARREGPLATLAADGHKTLAGDMSDETLTQRVFDTLMPDVLVVCGGARPELKSVQDHTWETFSRNWESDVHGSFNFVKAALTKPLKRGATVILVSSGAGLNGSPLSGGYSGAKRMQMFLSEYAQEESGRHDLGLRFVTIVPKTIMRETTLGQQASDAYAAYRGVTVEQFQARFQHPQTAHGVANALITLVTEQPTRSGNVFAVDGLGITEIP